MRWFLDLMYGRPSRACGLKVDVSGPPEAGEPGRATRPLIVLSRHAGPGDSLLLVHYLLSVCERRPRVVMKATLQLDPSMDILANRVPNAFSTTARPAPTITSTRSAWPRAWTGAARWPSSPRAATGPRTAGAGPSTACGAGPPRPGRTRGGDAQRPPTARGGALAAIEACPAADVIFVAHTGLDRLVSVRDVWRGLRADMRGQRPLVARPRRRASRARLTSEAQLTWLYDWWQRIDAWITAENADQTPPQITAVTGPDPLI